MNIKNNELKCLNLNKVCNFHAGDGHFFATVLPFLIDKIEKGSKALLFVDDNIINKLPGIVRSLYGEGKFEQWQKNIVFYPPETINKVDKYFANHIKDMLGLLSLSCSEEGLIICVRKAGGIKDTFAEQIESVISNIAVPVFLVNCYEFADDKQSILKVLDNHNFLLNTIGISVIEKVYPEINIKVLAQY